MTDTELLKQVTSLPFNTFQSSHTSALTDSRPGFLVLVQKHEIEINSRSPSLLDTWSSVMSDE